MKDAYSQALELRELLHKNPEPSGCEHRTKQILIDFLKSNSDLEIIDCGKWFYAAHREADAETGIAFRADMDAILGADGNMYHGCGHDGHSSVVAALAAWTNGQSFGKNIFFLFQHAEETGEGGGECVELFKKENISAIFGFHNCPGFEAGAVLMLHDTFACASRGLTLSFSGTQSHAAYPENGRNPIFPMTELFSHWAEITDKSLYKGLTMATPCGFSAGAKAFGVAAGSGEIYLTLRAWYDDDLNALQDRFLGLARKLADDAGINYAYSIQDVFPATINNDDLYQICADAAKEEGLTCLVPHEPFRWSEDFGHYGAHTRAFFVGIGGGEDAYGLHTPEYCWNNATTDSALRFFKTLAKQNI